MNASDPIIQADFINLRAGDRPRMPYGLGSQGLTIRIPRAMQKQCEFRRFVAKTFIFH